MSDASGVKGSDKPVARHSTNLILRPFQKIAEIWASPVPGHGGFLAAVVLGWCVELIFGISSQPSYLEGVRAFCILWFSSGAAFFLGAIAGFLFGVPKAIRDANPAEPGQYRDNTNLEEVSDWITKILVGLGIAQFGEIVGIVGKIGEGVGTSIGGANGANVIAISSILYGFICGFLWHYVWTRVMLLKEFESQKQRGQTPDPDQSIVEQP